VPRIAATAGYSGTPLPAKLGIFELPKLAVRGMIWICWPKRTSGLAIDVTEDTVRKHALPLGLVDVKVCAIDVTWSGLKLVRRRVPQAKP